MFYRLACAIARRPGVALLICVAGLLALLAGLRHFEVDRSIDAVIMPGDPDKPFLEEMKERFGSDEIVVVAVVAPDGADVFQAATLEKVKDLTAALEAVPGVSTVKSIANANHIESAPDGVRTDPLFLDVPGDADRLAEVRRKALSDSLFLGNLVSRDGRATAIVCTFTPECDRDARAQFAAAIAIRDRAAAAAGPERVYASGVPLNKVANSEMARHDLRTIGPVLLLANATIIFVLFRTARGLLLPVASIILTVAVTLGIMGHFGIPINTYTNYVPLFLIMLGAVYGVHTMAHYYFEVGRQRLRPPATPERREETIRSYLGEFLYPFALVIVTTFFGFASLAWNPIPAVWQLGIFTAAGCLVLFPLCGVAVPAVLRLLDAPKRLPPRPREAPMQFAWIWLAKVATERSRLVVAIWAVITAVSLYGATRITQSTNTLEWLPPAHPLRIAETAIQEALGATAVLNFYVETGEEDGAIEPTALARLARLEDFARSLPETDSALALIDYLEPLKRAILSDGSAGPTGRLIPESREEAAQLLMLYSKPDDLARYLDDDRSSLRLMVRLNDRSSPALTRVSEKVLAEAQRLGFPDGSVRAASTLMLIAHSLDKVAAEMVVSTFTSFMTVLPVLMLLTRSARVGLIAMIPNTVPSIVVFGLMGFAGYRLDAASSTIAAITLGIAVDDTIHFLSKFRRMREEGASTVRALEIALREEGPAMLFATGVLALSLLITNISGYQPVRHLGQLAAFGFFVCLVAELTLHPALLALFAPKRWKGAALPEDVRARAAAADRALPSALLVSREWSLTDRDSGERQAATPAGTPPTNRLEN